MLEAYMRTRRRKMEAGTLQEQPVQGYGWVEEVRSVPWRRVIFWLHLVTGILAGLVIGVMSVTGVLLAFERQIVAFAERDVRTVPPPVSGGPRLALDDLVAKALAAVPAGQLSGVMLRADPMATVVVNFGREQMVFVHPYTGAILGEGAKTLRSFFHAVTDWHRWLGTEGESRDIGRAITGACNTAFVVMVVTGVYLWWPRRWTHQVWQAVMVPNLGLRGKPRDWNWHNTAGFWSASLLLCITLTGLVMSYQWANDLLYTLTGNVPPPRPPGAAEGRSAAADNRRNGGGPHVAGSSPDGGAGWQFRAEGQASRARQGHPGEAGEAGSTSQRASLEALFAVAAQQAPHWRSMTVRVPQRGASQLTVTLEEAKALHPYPRSILTLDAGTAAVVQWEPYASYNLGRTLRAWVRPVHTGEAGGVVGQTVATLASACGVVLVWTGLALAWRRFRARNARASRRTSDVTLS
jgi:uncharacterized iron-regulated membrane protein